MRIANLFDLRTEQYERNEERYRCDGECCIICGKPLKNSDIAAGHWVHWLPNGDITDSQELIGVIPDCAELGWWQIGNTCYRNFLKAAHDVPVMTWRAEQGY